MQPDVNSKGDAESDTMRESFPRGEGEAGNATLSGIPGGSPPVIAGRYQLLRAIGRGGMGVVYLAEDRTLRRHVAVKRLVARSNNLRIVQRRFLREAQTIASLAHIHIVTIYDISQDHHGNYIVMEYVAGPQPEDAAAGPPPPMNLERYVREHGPVPADMACDLVMKVCSALQYAHHRGIVHRDIKPSNLLLDGNLEPKLVDFGLARAIDMSRTEEITLDGALLGTPEYSAPEQWGDARRVDARADIYALAGVLFYMLSGKLPRYFRPQALPADLREVLAKGLAQRPDERFQSMDEFAAALHARHEPAPADAPAAVPVPAAPSPDPGTLTLAGLTAGIWTCPNCQQQNPEAAKYCTRCGVSGQQHCPVCHSEFRVGTAFCPNCGSDLQQAEEAAGIIMQVRNLMAGMEFESALNTLRQLPGEQPGEIQKLVRELHDTVLKRRNLLLELDGAVRTYNVDKAVRAASELKGLIPEDCISESADFDVVVKSGSLLDELRQQLVDAAARAREELNLQKFERCIQLLNQVFGEEVCAGVNDQLAQVQTTLNQTLTQAGLALGYNCLSRAREILEGVPAWKGGDLGDRRGRLAERCRESIEARVCALDELELLLRDNKYSEALRQIRGMARFRPPPSHSEVEPAADDRQAHYRIQEIDKVLLRRIADEVAVWVAENHWERVTDSLEALKGGEAATWREAGQKLRDATNREIVRRYNQAVGYERHGQYPQAEKAWLEFAEIPEDLVPANLIQFAEEFVARRDAYLLTRTERLLRRGGLLLLIPWLFYLWPLGRSLFQDIPEGAGAARVIGLALPAIAQLWLFILVYLAGHSRTLERLERKNLSWTRSPRLFCLLLLAALSPLSFCVVSGGLAALWASALLPGFERPAAFLLTAAGWFAVDLLRRADRHRLPWLGLGVSWCIVGGCGAFFWPASATTGAGHVELVWPALAIGHALLLAILAGLPRLFARRSRAALTEAFTETAAETKTETAKKDAGQGDDTPAAGA